MTDLSRIANSMLLTFAQAMGKACFFSTKQPGMNRGPFRLFRER
jgi:hypothetical protein